MTRTGLDVYEVRVYSIPYMRILLRGAAQHDFTCIDSGGMPWITTISIRMHIRQHHGRVLVTIE